MFRNGWITRASDPITDSWLWATMWLVDTEFRKLFTTEHLSNPLAVVILKAHFPLHWCHNIIADLLCHLLPSLLLPNTQQKQLKEEEFILVLAQRVWTILAEKSWQVGWVPPELLLFYIFLNIYNFLNLFKNFVEYISYAFELKFFFYPYSWVWSLHDFLDVLC